MSAASHPIAVTDDAERLALAARRYVRSGPTGDAIVPGCVHRSLIVDVLNDASDVEGLDPLRLLKCVLLAYPAERLCHDGGAAVADLLRTIDRHLPNIRAA